MPPSGPPVAQPQLPIDNTYEDTNAQSSPSDDGGDDYDGDSSYNPTQNRRPTPSSRNDLNSNIMKLEE